MLNWLKRLAVLLLLLAVLAFGVMFSLQNTQPVALDLLFIQLSEQYLALWVLSAFALGGLVGLLISSIALMQLRASHIALRHKLERRKKELDALRTGPVK